MKVAKATKENLTKAAVLKLVQKGEITASRGAELLKMNYHDFIDLMNEHNIPLWNYTKEAMDESMKNVDRALKNAKNAKDAKNAKVK